MTNRAIFLDRDGTVIRAVSRPEIRNHATAWSPWYVNEINFEPSLGEALKIFRDFGYLIVIVTNQPDVTYGNITEERWQEIQDIAMKEVKPDAIYICRHGKKDGCPRKKPLPGMLKDAEDNLNLNLAESFMIGDTENDVLAGKRAGCKTILIRRPYNRDNTEANQNADFVVKSLLEAAAIV